MITFTYKVNGGKAMPCTPDDLRSIRRLPCVVDTAGRLKEITEQMAWLDASSEEYQKLDREKKAIKMARPAVMPHASSFVDMERKNQNATPSGLVMFDVDHMQGDIRQFYEDKIKAFVDEWNIALVEISASGDGLHIFFEKPVGMTIQESQKWLADLLGVAYDEGTFDLARACFIVGEDYVLYQNDDRLFKAPNPNPSPARGKGVDTPSEASPQPSPKEREYVNTLSDSADSDGQGNQSTSPSFSAVAMKAAEPSAGRMGGAFALRAFDLCLTEAGLTSAEIDIPGEHNWHNTLKAVLSVGLCQLMDKELLLGAIKTRMPNYYETEDCRRLVGDFYKNYCDENGRMSLTLRKIYAQAIRSLTPSLSKGEGAPDGIDSPLLVGEGQGVRLPKMPRLLQLLIKAYPEEYRPAVVLSSLVFLGTLLSRLRAYYLDGATHSPSFFCAVSAPQASGKSFTRRLYELLTAPIKEQDQIGRRLEQEYKEKCKAAKNNRQQPEDPRPMIRLVPATASNAMILKRADYAKGLHLCTYAEEIDTLVKGQKAGAWSQKSDIYRMAFDNAEWGQDYMSDNSYSGQVKLFYNLLVCGTPNAMNRYFTDVEDGLVSRVMFVNLPDMLGAKMPRFGSYTRKDLKEIQDTVRKLYELGSSPNPGPFPARGKGVDTSSDSALSDNQKHSDALAPSGEREASLGDAGKGVVWVNIPRLSDVIDEWLEEKRKLYLLDQDNPALEVFRRRSAVCGFRAGMVAYALYGMKWNAGVGEFAVWVAEHTLQNQLTNFGERMNQIMLQGKDSVKANATVQTTGKNIRIFAQLPDEFTDSQLVQMRLNIGQGERVDYILSRWWKNGLIAPIGNRKWKKV